MTALVKWGWGKGGPAARVPGDQVLRTNAGAGVGPETQEPRSQAFGTCTTVPSNLTDKIELKGKIIKNFKTLTVKH